MGLSERTSITTFTPFFSDLTLPPSVKRGEVLPVKISVFNYLDQPLPVSSKAVQVKHCDAEGSPPLPSSTLQIGKCDVTL